MDSNKLWLWIGGLLLAGFLALPLLSDGSRSRQPAEPPPSEAVQAPPPGLTAADLVNTTWDVPTGQGVVRATLYSGGRVVATPPEGMASLVKQMTGQDVLEGTWTLSGAHLTVEAQVGPVKQRTTCQVQGMDIFCEGQQAIRVQ